jgi:hypothetical protein
VNEPTGVKRALNAAWDQLPHILIAAIISIFVFIGGLWLGHRDLSRDVAALQLAEQSPALCERLGVCSALAKIGGMAGDCIKNAERLDTIFNIHDRNDAQWQSRIVRLEQQMYELQSWSRQQHDPSTGTMPYQLNNRLKSLEQKD